MGSQTKVFSGLRWLFMLCFGVAVWCVITVYAPLIGALLFLTGLLIVVSRTNVSRRGGVKLLAGTSAYFSLPCLC